MSPLTEKRFDTLVNFKTAFCSRLVSDSILLRNNDSSTKPRSDLIRMMLRLLLRLMLSIRPVAGLHVMLGGMVKSNWAGEHVAAKRHGHTLLTSDSSAVSVRWRRTVGTCDIVSRLFIYRCPQRQWSVKSSSVENILLKFHLTSTERSTTWCQSLGGQRWHGPLKRPWTLVR